jgi:hypothetical protein
VLQLDGVYRDLMQWKGEPMNLVFEAPVTVVGKPGAKPTFEFEGGGARLRGLLGGILYYLYDD